MGIRLERVGVAACLSASLFARPLVDRFSAGQLTKELAEDARMLLHHCAFRLDL